VTTRPATEVARSAQSALLAKVAGASAAIFGVAGLLLQGPASGEPAADIEGPGNTAGYRHAACKRSRNLSSDKHAAEIWIFEACAANQCFADRIPRKVLCPRDRLDRLLEGRPGIFIES